MATILEGGGVELASSLSMGPTARGWRTAKGPVYPSALEMAEAQERRQIAEAYRSSAVSTVVKHVQRGGYVTDEMRALYGPEISAALGSATREED